MPVTGFASKAARELADEFGLNADSIRGTGRDGRVTISDVRDATPKQLAGLGERGQALFDSVIASVPEDLELDDRERSVLQLAARQADELAKLEEVIDEQGVTTLGSQGQVVTHPAVSEARQARLAIGRLLGQLPLPDEAVGDGTDASRRGARAARARWSRRGTQGRLL